MAAIPVKQAATKQKTTVKEKRIYDFKPIKLEWLQEKPSEPELLAQFSSDLGDFEVYYHRLITSEAILYLVFDKRCKSGRFVPKMGGSVVSLTIDNMLYRGVLWAAARFEIGVLEITPFILALETEEDEQTNY